MAHNPQQQERLLLNKDELTLVDNTHHPMLAELSDAELTRTHKLLRDKRDKARQTADRQRREMRGKSDPKGTRPARDNTGTHQKKDLLAEALFRIDEELKRRQQKLSRQTLIESAKRALELRRANEAKGDAPEMRPATKSKKAKPKTAQIKARAPKNPAKAGAVSQHTKNMQAKRDAK